MYICICLFIDLPIGFPINNIISLSLCLFNLFTKKRSQILDVGGRGGGYGWTSPSPTSMFIYKYVYVYAYVS